MNDFDRDVFHAVGLKIQWIILARAIGSTVHADRHGTSSSSCSWTSNCIRCRSSSGPSTMVANNSGFTGRTFSRRSSSARIKRSICCMVTRRRSTATAVITRSPRFRRDPRFATSEKMTGIPLMKSYRRMRSTRPRRTICEPFVATTHCIGTAEALHGRFVDQ
jgi:hypothetical protein